MAETLALRINGKQYEVPVEPHDSLNSVLRNKLGLTGTKRGCDTGGCGACSVIVDGRAVYSCMLLAYKAVGKKITTIEGLSREGVLHPVQQAFIDEGGLQCGYCTPGMIISVAAILERHPDPDEAEIREAIVGNLCRCTGYAKIVDAALSAAMKMRSQKPE